MYNKESCYLSELGCNFIDLLVERYKLDRDLALELAHNLIPSEELYELEVIGPDSGSDR